VQEIRASESRLVTELHSLYGEECMDALGRRHDLASLRDDLRSASSLTELIIDSSKDIELLLLNNDVQSKLSHLTSDDKNCAPPDTASKVRRRIQHSYCAFFRLQSRDKLEMWGGNIILNFSLFIFYDMPCNITQKLTKNSHTLNSTRENQTKDTAEQIFFPAKL